MRDTDVGCLQGIFAVIALALVLLAFAVWRLS